MNKNLSLAIERAVEKISPKDNFPLDQNEAAKKPDLFSLTSQTELFQNDKGITIKIDRSKDAKLTDFGKITLSDRYLGQNESYQDLFVFEIICEPKPWPTLLIPSLFMSLGYNHRASYSLNPKGFI